MGIDGHYEPSPRDLVRHRSEEYEVPGGTRADEARRRTRAPPFIYRTAVILQDAEGWTVREIADLQGISSRLVPRGPSAGVSSWRGH